MAIYNPPSENLEIFESSVFVEPNEVETGGGGSGGDGLTEAEADALYLSKLYPTNAAAVVTFSSGLLTNSLSTTIPTNTLSIGNPSNTGRIDINTGSSSTDELNPAIGIGLSGSAKLVKLNNNNGLVQISGLEISGSTINNITNDTGNISIGGAQTTGDLFIGAGNTRSGLLNIGGNGTGSIQIQTESTNNTDTTPAISIGTGGVDKLIKINNATSTVNVSGLKLNGTGINPINNSDTLFLNNDNVNGCNIGGPISTGPYLFNVSGTGATLIGGSTGVSSLDSGMVGSSLAVPAVRIGTSTSIDKVVRINTTTGVTQLSGLLIEGNNINNVVSETAGDILIGSSQTTGDLLLGGGNSNTTIRGGFLVDQLVTTNIHSLGYNYNPSYLCSGNTVSGSGTTITFSQASVVPGLYYYTFVASFQMSNVVMRTLAQEVQVNGVTEDSSTLFQLQANPYSTNGFYGVRIAGMVNISSSSSIQHSFYSSFTSGTATMLTTGTSRLIRMG